MEIREDETGAEFAVCIFLMEASAKNELSSEGNASQMSFRKHREDVLLWPTGAGAGELIPAGRLEFTGGPVQCLLVTCPSSEVNSIYFHGQDTTNIKPGGPEFGFIFRYTGIYCQQGYSLVIYNPESL